MSSKEVSFEFAVANLISLRMSSAKFNGFELMNGEV